MSPLILTVLCLPLSLTLALSLSFCRSHSDYPHKYGPEGGCANSSVFEKMKKYQASAMEEEEPFQVNSVAPREAFSLPGRKFCDREINGPDWTGLDPSFY